MEKFENLGKNGKVYFKSELKGKSSRILNEFLLESLKNFANVSMNFVRQDLEDFPFIYGEKTLPSVLIPAFRMASKEKIVFSEYPVDREKLTDRSTNGSKEKIGRVDYFIFHNGLEIIVETKFSWISYNSLKLEFNLDKSIKKELFTLLGKAIEQIRSVKWEGVEKLVLMVVPIYYAISSKKDVKVFKEIKGDLIENDLISGIYNTMLTRAKNFLAEFQPFLGYWFLSTFHEYYLEWENRKEAYPYILFLGGRV
ncbi:hypothetical protein SAMN06269117_10389 [Balnearium lithotrophicum]|uniref:Uncharacterized protein n=1 Tax=Balnearium lithotrophicum TaxID=223788 RepID=A0A521B2F9_9BACT|nr:hypothetical protein [Balnearium lithotrophicum]SMO41273.1 hypothetical protein SAMN06269117_10389 [Balnearium lithotrophicum]